MKELFAICLWSGICTLSVLFWWPLLLTVIHYWVEVFS